MEIKRLKDLYDMAVLLKADYAEEYCDNDKFLSFRFSWKKIKKIKNEN